jgi:hypothetical protein
VGHERLQHRDGRDAAVARDGLCPARQPRDAREAGLLGEVRGELQVRVEARLDPPVPLEEQSLPQDDRRVRLVAADSAKAWASRADVGVSPLDAYQRRPASVSRSRARTAAATAARSRVTGIDAAAERAGGRDGRSTVGRPVRCRC